MDKIKIIFIALLDERIVSEVCSLAKKMLKNFYYTPCYQCKDGQTYQTQLLKFFATNNDDKIEFLMFHEKCSRQGYSFDFIETKGE